jgi:hypothetical protein
MKLVDPTVLDSQRSHSRGEALTSLSGLTIGVLSNGKQKADVLLNKTAAKLQHRYGGKVLPMQAKVNAGAPAPGDMLTNLTHECDYLLTAAGD